MGHYRNNLTTGLLLLTNDGQLAQKLAHPSKQIKKIYEVILAHPIQAADLKATQDGIRLTDGIVQVDEIAIASADQKVLGHRHTHGQE